ncbi:MAG TPA: Nif3-like dinuclear metal center hexameric protein [Terriglobia bacterium]|jgi:putative NIF3 family GTP cyclohydrolase 1 type 2
MPALTADEVVSRIKANLGIPWRDATYRDTFKFGGAATEVRGIATAMFCNFELLQRAAEAGLNMIIPHEDTYWNDRDDVTIVNNDPLYKVKVDFMTKHNIVIFRMHDHMHAQRPDFTYVGLARALGLDSKSETAPQSHHFTIPETTLGALAADFQKRLGLKALRAVGDPNRKVRRIQLGVGYATPAVNSPDVDVVVSGELQETDGGFDSPEYVLDAVSLGIPKGWIMLGHAVSEEQGMLEMAQWVKSFIPEVPVQLIRTGEPFWVPK